jgi:pyruvate dehydrogenase complex dehydrogenase (E1) component
VRYLKERREELGGPFPARRGTTEPVSPAPSADLFEEFDKGTPAEPDGVSTTMASCVCCPS